MGVQPGIGDTAFVMETTSRQPFILGIGGTSRRGSATERVLQISLEAAREEGAETALVAGDDLKLPMYAPGVSDRTPEAARLVSLFRKCDGVIIASPAYHGSLSGLLKNALDYTEDLRGDERVYFDGCAVGCICCAGGWQAGGQTLAALRAIAHALRGWPTPLGAVVNTSLPVFGEDGSLADGQAVSQLRTVGWQVTHFARMARHYREAGR
ncbi:NADPH-dependent FMN reductase [Kaustia mangrovi]|nr:NAD(P)H-dependent oxidoreductase [Kaustia mangrovi]